MSKSQVHINSASLSLPQAAYCISTHPWRSWAEKPSNGKKKTFSNFTNSSCLFQLRLGCFLFFSCWLVQFKKKTETRKFLKWSFPYHYPHLESSCSNTFIIFYMFCAVLLSELVNQSGYIYLMLLRMSCASICASNSLSAVKSAVSQLHHLMIITSDMEDWLSWAFVYWQHAACHRVHRVPVCSQICQCVSNKVCDLSFCAHAYTQQLSSKCCPL